ncbi:MAG: hypothetical protein HYY68_01380 [Thaumarchaeota archaeon]|nr:hypothetical protein [Nitrososphaerota archaeon]
MTRYSQISVLGGAIVLLSGVLGAAGFLPPPAAGASQAAGLGIWRLMGGSLILATQERDLLRGAYIVLLLGASLAVVGGLWVLSKRRA